MAKGPFSIHGAQKQADIVRKLWKQRLEGLGKRLLLGNHVCGELGAGNVLFAYTAMP